jgi:hypothetical protein
MNFGNFLRFWAAGGQEELVFGAAWATETQSIEPEDSLEMREEHLDLLSFST